MRIYIGADHAGFRLKSELTAFLADSGYEVVDKGAYELALDDDYPDFVAPVARAVADDLDSMGIILGGSGQGEAIAANRVEGARAAVWYGGNKDIITLSREHNNANILSIGARFMEGEDVNKTVALWLDTAFSGDERHRRRLKKIDSIISAPERE